MFTKTEHGVQQKVRFNENRKTFGTICKDNAHR